MLGGAAAGRAVGGRRQGQQGTIGGAAGQRTAELFEARDFEAGGGRGCIQPEPMKPAASGGRRASSWSLRGRAGEGRRAMATSAMDERAPSSCELESCVQAGFAAEGAKPAQSFG